MLKPMLARGELHCIGATTLDEYRKHIEKDAALERRFQPVLVDQPTVEDTISILRGLRERFEVHHGVKIQDSALVAAAVLSNRYITDRFLPDKAIDLVDEACAMIRTEIDSMPAELDEVERGCVQLEIEEVALAKGARQGQPRKAPGPRKELAELQRKADAMKAQWEAEKAVDQKGSGPFERKIEKVRHEIEAAEREYNLAENRRTEIWGASGPGKEAARTKRTGFRKGRESRLLREMVTEEEIADIVIPLDRHSGDPAGGRRAGKTAAARTKFCTSGLSARMRPFSWSPTPLFAPGRA